MSTILKALRKLEQSKGEALERPLREEVVSDRPPQRARTPWFALAGALLGGIAATAFMLRPEPTPTVSAQAPTGKPAVAIAREPARRAPAAPPVQPSAAVPRPEAPALAQVPEASPPVPVQPPAVAVEPTSSTRAALAARIAEKTSVTPADPEPRVEPVAAPAPQPALSPAAPVRPARANARTASPGTVRPAMPPIELDPPPPAAPAPSVPSAEDTAFPRLLVAKTMWHPTPERRVATVQFEGRVGSVELHEGDEAGSVLVEKIGPSSVVFFHDGATVRRKVGVRP